MEEASGHDSLGSALRSCHVILTRFVCFLVRLSTYTIYWRCSKQNWLGFIHSISECRTYPYLSSVPTQSIIKSGDEAVVNDCFCFIGHDTKMLSIRGCFRLSQVRRLRMLCFYVITVVELPFADYSVAGDERTPVNHMYQI